jgi:hypothetical protein
MAKSNLGAAIELCFGAVTDRSDLQGSCHATSSGTEAFRRFGAVSPVCLDWLRVREPLELRGNKRPDMIFNNAHTVQPDFAEGDALHMSHRGYALVQFHFHHPSEHLIEGKERIHGRAGQIGREDSRSSC